MEPSKGFQFVSKNCVLLEILEQLKGGPEFGTVPFFAPVPLAVAALTFRRSARPNVRQKGQQWLPICTMGHWPRLLRHGHLPIGFVRCSLGFLRLGFGFDVALIFVALGFPTRLALSLLLLVFSFCGVALVDFMFVATVLFLVASFWLPLLGVPFGFLSLCSFGFPVRLLMVVL